MEPNPFLNRLGFAPDDRVVILHTDDIGMCQASVAAFADLHRAGIISSGSVMVPCPWFLQAALFARHHPDADLGVHLTLTSEWPTYRWGPISTRDQDTGLLDDEGYFPHHSHQVQDSGVPVHVQIELEAQIKAALQAGMQPTHIDTHMGSVTHVKFMGIYIALAWSYHLPPMAPRLDEAGFMAMGMDQEAAAMARWTVQEQESLGLPLIDCIVGMPLDTPENRLERTRQALADLKPGITHFVIHPSVDTPELRAITPDWACRVADYRDFMLEELRTAIRDLGIQVIGYRRLQEVMPRM